MTELPDPELSAEHEHSFLRGLRLDRLQPGNALAFFSGLPHRIAALTGRSDAGSDDDRSLLIQQRGVTEAIADEMERLIGVVKSYGYPLNPSINVEPGESDEAVNSSTRIRAGSNELMQRLAGVAPEEWGDDETIEVTLLSDTRAAIGRIAQSLRDLQQMNPDMDDSDGSAEELPSDAGEIESARDDIEALTQSISSERQISAPGPTTVGCSPGEAPGGAGFDSK